MNKKSRTDHLGQIFESTELMCKHWNIPVSTFNSRIYKKWSLEKALTHPIGMKFDGEIYIDHLGNEFSSISAMGRYWNIPSSTLQARLMQKHMSIKDALTLTEDDMHRINRQCEDHLGNKFNSKVEMCEHYNIPRQVFFGRIGLGWSLKDALLTPIDNQPKNSKTITDHLGNTFKSVSDLCEHWKIRRSTYNARMKAGWSMEQALTTPTKDLKIQRQSCKDHLGNEYPSIEAMCKAYGISRHTYSTRVNKLGWTVEDALTTNYVINSIECTDFAGNKFPTKIDMANYYAIPVYFIQKNNVTDNDLINLIKKHYTDMTLNDIHIHKCISFPYFKVTIDNVKLILNIEHILNNYHNSISFNPLPESKIQDKHLEIKKCINFPYYSIAYNNESMIWSYWDIINYRRNTNFGLSSQKG